MIKILFVALIYIIANLPSFTQNKVYDLISDINELNDGDEIILVNIQNKRVLRSIEDYDNPGDLKMIGVTVKDASTISNPVNAMQIKLEADKGNWLFKTGDRYIKSRQSSIGFSFDNKDPENDNLINITIDPNNSFAKINFINTPLKKFIYDANYGRLIYNNPIVTSDEEEDRQYAISIFKLKKDEEEKPETPTPILPPSDNNTDSISINWIIDTPTNQIIKEHNQSSDKYTVTTTYETYNGTLFPRSSGSTHKLRLCKGNKMTISVPEPLLITKLKFYLSEEPFDPFISATCNNEPIDNNATEWTPLSPVRTVSIINGLDDGGKLYTSIDSIRIILSTKQIAPDPIVTYDSSTDIISMQLLDSDGNTFKDFFIFYGFTEVGQTPDKESLNQVFDAPTLLSGICTEPGTYDLWVYAQIEGYNDSPMKKYGPFTVEPYYHDPDDIEYKILTDNILTETHWYLITSADGSYALGTATTNNTYTARDLKISNIGYPHYWAKHNEFDEKGILEFQYLDGQFIEKRTKNPLQPHISTTIQTASDKSAQITIEKNDNNHIIKIDGQQLGFDGTTFGFDEKHRQSLQIFTTGKSINTGVENINIPEENTPAIYYNLQGIQTTNPQKGLYIKQQGNKTTKVIIR